MENAGRRSLRVLLRRLLRGSDSNDLHVRARYDLTLTALPQDSDVNSQLYFRDFELDEN